MGKHKNRFVGRAEAGKGWRIWDNLQKKWWGERYESFPDCLIAELNADKLPERITELIRHTPRKRV